MRYVFANPVKCLSLSVALMLLSAWLPLNPVFVLAATKGPVTTVDKVYSTQVNGRTFDMLIPKGISTVRGIIFYGPGVNGNSRSALTDIGYITKSHIFGYPIITYDKGSAVVPRDCNTAISNIARQCGLAMETSTPIYAQGFSNGGGNTWSWPKSSPDRVISYFVNKGQTASGILPDAALGIP
ncbi:MAG: hypothetical protein ACLP9L_17865 [Thermoguttaceae bacterium]